MSESNHKVIEPLHGAPLPLERLYERDWFPDVEHRELYRPGGHRPVHIGDRFGTAGRFPLPT